MPLLILRLLILLLVVSAARSVHAADPILLPIEVLGPAGTEVERTVPVTDPSQVAGVWVMVNNLDFADKGSIKIGSADWIAMSNATVELPAKEAALEGIGGALFTIRFTVPVPSGALSSGDNPIRFRFDQADGLSIGYRVVRLQLVDSAGAFLLDDTAFVEDDPATWQPPRSSPSEIDAGRDLWYNAALVDSPLTNDAIRANCTDCHSEDGRDLKYFNYSNHSIIERSRFHGLSQADGERIASYIRDLDAPAPTTARPWNPPYQPGPGLDDLPVEYWAAGAGIDAVLESDADMRDHLFPNGQPHPDATPLGTLNMREMPVAIQFPDWKEWLPHIHPVDIWGDTFLDDRAYTDYIDVRNDFANGGAENQIANKDIINTIESLVAQQRSFWRYRNALEQRPAGMSEERAFRELRHWVNVKHFEIMHQFGNLEDAAPRIYDFGEARSWIGRGRTAFEPAPHLTADNGVNFVWQSYLVGKYQSTNWYQVQVSINSGNRDSVDIKPVDNNYQPNHIADLYGKAGGPAHPYRMTATFLKMYQQYHQPNTADPIVRMRQAHPGRWLGYDLYTDLPNSEQAFHYTAMLNLLMDIFDLHSVQSFHNMAAGGDFETPDYVITPLPDDNYSKWLHQSRYADAWWSMIGDFRDRGVPESTLNRVIDWGERIWPDNPWDDLRVASDTTPPAPPTGLTASPVP